LKPVTVHLAAVAVAAERLILVDTAAVAVAGITAPVDPETLAAAAVRQITLRVGLGEA
jgi:hypothetical protein